MRSKPHAPREARLAAALKENLKRRKAQAKAKAKPETIKTRMLGSASHAGLEDALSGCPKAAPK